MVQIKWLSQSIFDLEEIKNYIAYNSPLYAKITVQKLRKRTQILKKNIRSGRVVPEYEQETVRELIEGNFRIIYYVATEKEAWILTVVHGARDLTKIELSIKE